VRAGQIEVVAHRGASWDRPENSLAAFALAVRQGCDGIELDVQLSRDGVPVVYHDRTLTRAGGGRRRVAALDARELRRLRLRRIPLLEKVLDRYAAEVSLLIEIKLRDTPERLCQLAETVVAMLKGRKFVRRPRLLCFHPFVLSHVRRQSGKIDHVLNVRALDARFSKLRKHLDGLQAVSVNVRGVTNRLGTALAEHGLPLLVFTCNTPARVRKALEAGAATVMSDRPGWLRQQLTNDAGLR